MVVWTFMYFQVIAMARSSTCEILCIGLALVLVDLHLFVNIKLSNAKNMQGTEKMFCAGYALLTTTRLTPSEVVLIPHREQRYNNAEDADHGKEWEIERNVRPIHADYA